MTVVSGKPLMHSLSHISEKSVVDVQDNQLVATESADTDTDIPVTYVDEDDQMQSAAHQQLEEFSDTRKKWSVAIVSFCGLASPLSSHIYFPALISIAQDLHASQVAVNASISAYIFIMGIAPMGWASFADVHGRRSIYTVSLLIYVIATILCGLSVNVEMLIAMRVFQAMGSSSVIAVGAGTIADIYEPKVRGTAMGFFFQGPLIGPLLGPVIGGYLNEYLGWRSIFYVLAGLGALMLIMVAFFLPETLASARMKELERRKIKLATKVSFWQRLKNSARELAISFKGFNPLRPMKMLRYPAVVITTIVMACMISALYIILTTLPEAFTAIYKDLTSGQLGLLYLAGGLGNVIGSLTGGRATDMVRKRLVKKEVKRLSQISAYSNVTMPKPQIAPELRLTTGLFGAILVVLAYPAYGWVMQFAMNGLSVSIAVPLIVLFVLGFGNMFIMAGVCSLSCCLV